MSSEEQSMRPPTQDDGIQKCCLFDVRPSNMSFEATDAVGYVAVAGRPCIASSANANCKAIAAATKAPVSCRHGCMEQQRQTCGLPCTTAGVAHELFHVLLDRMHDKRHHSVGAACVYNRQCVGGVCVVFQSTARPRPRQWHAPMMVCRVALPFWRPRYRRNDTTGETRSFARADRYSRGMYLWNVRKTAVGTHLQQMVTHEKWPKFEYLCGGHPLDKNRGSRMLPLGVALFLWPQQTFRVQRHGFELFSLWLQPYSAKSCRPKMMKIPSTIFRRILQPNYQLCRRGCWMVPKNGTNQISTIHGTGCQCTKWCSIVITTANMAYDTHYYHGGCSYDQRHWLCTRNFSARAAVKLHILYGSQIQMAARDDAPHYSSSGFGCTDGSVAASLNDSLLREAGDFEKCNFASMKRHTAERRPFHCSGSGVWRQTCLRHGVLLPLERARSKINFRTTVFARGFSSKDDAISGDLFGILARAKPTTM